MLGFSFQTKVLTTVEESGISRLSRPDLDSVNIEPELDIELELDNELDLDNEPDLDSMLAESDSEKRKMIEQLIRIIHLILPPETREMSYFSVTNNQAKIESS